MARPEFVTLSEAGRRLRMDRHRIADAVARGELPAYRLGGRWVRLAWRDVEAWVAKHRVASRTAPDGAMQKPL